MSKHLILALTLTFFSAQSFASTFRCLSSSGSQLEMPIVNGQAVVSEQTADQSKERYKINSIVTNNHVFQLTVTDSKTELQVGAMAEMQSDSLYIEINQAGVSQSFTCAIFAW